MTLPTAINSIAEKERERVSTMGGGEVCGVCGGGDGGTEGCQRWATAHYLPPKLQSHKQSPGSYTAYFIGFHIISFFSIDF